MSEFGKFFATQYKNMGCPPTFYLNDMENDQTLKRALDDHRGIVTSLDTKDDFLVFFANAVMERFEEVLQELETVKENQEKLQDHLGC